jgi:hypothetical protein
MKIHHLLVLIPVFFVCFGGMNEQPSTQKNKERVWVFTTNYDDVRIEVSDGVDNDCSKNNIKGPFHVKKGKEFRLTGSGKVCYRRETYVGKDKDDWGSWIHVVSKSDAGKEEKIIVH